MEIRDRILTVVKSQFSVSDLDLPFEDLRIGSIEEWDSLANLNLLLALENEFLVRFSTEELAAMQSLVEIENYLKKKV